MIAMVIAVALVAIVVPSCRMIGCSMQSGYMGFMHSGDAFGLFNTCGGEYVSNLGPDGVVPPSAQALLLSLVAALAAVALVIAPQMSARPVTVLYATPPPPPEEPRGERFRV